MLPKNYSLTNHTHTRARVCVCMYKKDFVLKNLQELIRYKTKKMSHFYYCNKKRMFHEVWEFRPRLRHFICTISLLRVVFFCEFGSKGTIPRRIHNEKKKKVKTKIRWILLADTLHLSSCRVAHRPVVFTAARMWPSVCRYFEISFGLRAFPSGFYLSEGVIA